MSLSEVPAKHAARMSCRSMRPNHWYVAIRVGSHVQAHADGSNEAGRDEKPSIAVSQAIAAEVKNGYTMNVHNGDLAYADGFLADWDNYYGGLTAPETAVRSTGHHG